MEKRLNNDTIYGQTQRNIVVIRLKFGFQQKIGLTHTLTHTHNHAHTHTDFKAAAQEEVGKIGGGKKKK